MTKVQLVKSYEEGAMACRQCETPLPAGETWPGSTYRICDGAECITKIKTLPLKHHKGTYVGPDEIRCEGPGCEKFIPQGIRCRAPFWACSGKCWLARRAKGNTLLTCGCGCGQQFRGKIQGHTINGLKFLSAKHYGVFRHDIYLRESAGPFRGLVDEYLEGFARLHYAEQATVRKSIGTFFRYLTERKLTSLDEVTPKTITGYLIWGLNSKRSVASSISYLSTFFKWMIHEGYRKNANPVVSLMHGRRDGARLPRPLSKSDQEYTWELLIERGTACLRLATAIAEETGLRIGEIGRLRLQDMDFVKQRLFVRLPNKGSRERYAWFSEKTKKYYAEWMVERRPDCGHDHLLHNTRGGRCNTQQLGMAFSAVLCKTHLGKVNHKTGWDVWSTHRWRHTMGSELVASGADAATVMAAGGWLSTAAMCGYAKVDDSQAHRGYIAAMKQARANKNLPLTKTTILPSEFLARRHTAAQAEQCQ